VHSDLDMPNPLSRSRKHYALLAFLVCAVGALFAPRRVQAQGEVAEVRRMFSACTASGGRAASNYQEWVDQNGCICDRSGKGSGQISCPKSAVTTSPATTIVPNPMVTFVQSYQKALEENRVRVAAQRDAATAEGNRIAAGASRNAEDVEDAAQADDLTRYKARKAHELQNSQNSFTNAHDSASTFLNQSLTVSSNADSASGSAAAQKAWKQLHCMAYVSRIAFEDLALNDYSDYHDLSPEASKAFDGKSMDVSCPAAPSTDYGRGALEKVSNKLKSDLDQADQIAKRMEQYHIPPVNLQLPPDIAADPKLAAAWKMQKALNAIDAQPNPGKTAEEFVQVVKDRDAIKKSLLDSNNASNGDFGAIQVDLSPGSAGATSSPAGSSSATPPTTSVSPTQP
jgi:hypothetical protein